MKTKTLTSLLTLVCVLSLRAQTPPEIYFGEDVSSWPVNGPNNVPRPEYPRSQAVAAQFLSRLRGASTESFEGFPNGSLPATLTFGTNSAGLTAVPGSSCMVKTETDPAGTAGGTFPTSGTNWFELGLSGITGGQYFQVSFSHPQAAFGFYGNDVELNRFRLTLMHVDGSTNQIVPPITVPQGSGGVFYCGVIAGASPFTNVVFEEVGGASDGFGFDELTVGTPEQVIPPLVWDGRWEWYPDELIPGMAPWDDSAPEDAWLRDGVLTLTNDIPAEHLAYTLSGTNLLMPTKLIIEAEARVLRNFDTSDGKRTASSIQFTTAPNVGNMLWLETNEVFISDGVFTHGPSAPADTTDNFHNYRIEVDGTNAGSAVRVFQDGVLKITGSLYQGAPDHAAPILAFGDNSFYAAGGAEWRSLRHNAAARPTTVRPRLFIGPPPALMLHGLPGRSYAIESVSNLTQTTWSHATNLSLTTNAFGAVNVPADPPQRFYRGVGVGAQ